MAQLERQRLKLLVTVVERGMGDKVAELLRENGNYATWMCLGSGTAKQDIMELLGLNDLRKDVIISTILAERSKELMQALSDQLHMDEPGHGIAFTIPMSSVAGRQTYHRLASWKQEEGMDEYGK